MRRVSVHFSRLAIAASFLILIILLAHTILQEHCWPGDGSDSDPVIDENDAGWASGSRRRVIYPEDTGASAQEGTGRKFWWLAGKSSTKAKRKFRDTSLEENEVIGEEGLVTDWDDDDTDQLRPITSKINSTVSVGTLGGYSGAGPNPAYDLIAVAVKTGGEVALKRMPIQLLTFLQPVRNILIVGSEPNVTIGGHEVVDVYTDLYKKVNTEPLPMPAQPPFAVVEGQPLGPVAIPPKDGSIGFSPQGDSVAVVAGNAQEKADEAPLPAAPKQAELREGLKPPVKNTNKNAVVEEKIPKQVVLDNIVKEKEIIFQENNRQVDDKNEINAAELHDDDLAPAEPLKKVRIAHDNLIPDLIVDEEADEEDPNPDPPVVLQRRSFSAEEESDLVPDNESTGWKRDAHKNLPAFRLLLQKFPKADWYVMIDDDTYLFVENLRAMLEKMDPSHPWYLGSANVFMGCDGVKRFGDGPMFAHGGSGIVMSRAALNIMVENIDACIWKYRDCWAGDVRTALCLRDLDIYVTNTPGFWGSSPSPKTSWPSKPCERPNTFHHLKPSKIQLLYNIETSIRKSRPAHPYVTTADVYRAIMARNETSTLEIDVDRPGYDMRSLRTASAVDCKIACQADEMCMAFTFSWGGDVAAVGGDCWLKNGVPEKRVGIQNRASGVIEGKYVCGFA